MIHYNLDRYLHRLVQLLLDVRVPRVVFVVHRRTTATASQVSETGVRERKREVIRPATL